MHPNTLSVLPQILGRLEVSDEENTAHDQSFIPCATCVLQSGELGIEDLENKCL